MDKKIFRNKYYTEKELKFCNFNSLGKNVLIHEKINICGIENVSIGSNVRIDPYTNIVAIRPITIGSYIHIGSYCLLQGAEGIVIEDLRKWTIYAGAPVRKIRYRSKELLKLKKMLLPDNQRTTI